MEVNMNEAKAVYNTVCDALDARKWRYEKHSDDLVVSFTVGGEDIPMDFIIAVDARRTLIRLLSRLPFTFPADKRLHGSIATNFANYQLSDGSFDFNLSDGTIMFRMTSSYRGSLISDRAINYMVSCASAMVDKYNDKFLMIAKGVLKLEDFLLSKDN